MGGGVRRWWQRLESGWRHVRGNSTRMTARLLFHRYVYRAHRFVVTRATLAGPPAATCAGDIVFRLATPADLDRLDELDRYGRGARHRFYVEKDGDWLFVACHGERIVATRRYSRTLPGPSKDGHGLTSRVVRLEPDQAAEPWPPTFREHQPLEAIPGYRKDAPLAGAADAIAGPFGIRVERVRADGGLEIELRAVGPDVPNLPAPAASPIASGPFG